MLTRRIWLASLALAASARAARAENEIVQPATASPEAFMERAFAMKRKAEESGDQSYGAIIVRDGKIVGEAPSAVVTKNDPTAHAEMEAIRDAARRLGSSDLSGCTIYSSSRPCPMCEAAAYWAGIEKMVHGSALSDAGAPRLRRC